jgi:hypothetical protein
MVRRVRLLVALVALAVASLLAGSTALAADVAGGVDIATEALTAAADAGSTWAARPAEHVRRLPPVSPAAGSAFLSLVLVAVALTRGTIGAYGTHRLTDVGDAWRSLLLGAPPAAR